MPNKSSCPVANHTTWASYIRDGKVKYIVTSKTNNRDFYFLYKIDGDKYTRVAKAKSPLDLENHIERSDANG